MVRPTVAQTLAAWLPQQYVERDGRLRDEWTDEGVRVRSLGGDEHVSQPEAGDW